MERKRQADREGNREAHRNRQTERKKEGDRQASAGFGWMDGSENKLERCTERDKEKKADNETDR